MAVLPVLAYPHPLLKQKAPALSPGDPQGPRALEDLEDTLAAHPGCVGLAAPQAGRLVRALVVDVSRCARACENHGLLGLLNPEILEASQWKAGREGCLSFPDLLANVKRAQRIRVKAFDGKWEAVDLVFTGFEAVALQHEIDHLDGILFPWRLSALKRDLIVRRIRKLQKTGEWK